MTTPSCVGPPVIKQEQTIIHRRERGLFSSQADRCSFKTFDCRSLNRQRRTHHSNGRRRRIDFRTRHIHCTILFSCSSGIGFTRGREFFVSFRLAIRFKARLAHLFEYKEEEDKLAKRQKKVETNHRNKGVRARGIWAKKGPMYRSAIPNPSLKNASHPL